MTASTIASPPDRTTVSQSLATWIALVAAADIPEQVRIHTRDWIAVTVGDALAGVGSTDGLRAYAESLGSPPQATVLGGGNPPRRLAIMSAALVNGGAAGFARRSLAASVVPAALAVAEHRASDIAALVTAVLIGLEVAERLSAGLGERHANRGWSAVGTAGRIGACAAVARLIDLPVDQVLNALGVASTGAAAIAQPAATEAAALEAGVAAADGVEAALLARAGAVGPPAPIEGRRGLFALEFGEDPARVIDGLGQRYLLTAAPMPPDDRGEPIRATLQAPHEPVTRLIAAVQMSP